MPCDVVPSAKLGRRRALTPDQATALTERGDVLERVRLAILWLNGPGENVGDALTTHLSLGDHSCGRGDYSVSDDELVDAVALELQGKFDFASVDDEEFAASLEPLVRWLETSCRPDLADRVAQMTRSQALASYTDSYGSWVRCCEYPDFPLRRPVEPDALAAMKHQAERLRIAAGVPAPSLDDDRRVLATVAKRGSSRRRGSSRQARATRRVRGSPGRPRSTDDNSDLDPRDARWGVA